MFPLFLREGIQRIGILFFQFLQGLLSQLRFETVFDNVVTFCEGCDSNMMLEICVERTKPFRSVSFSSWLTMLDFFLFWQEGLPKSMSITLT